MSDLVKWGILLALIAVIMAVVLSSSAFGFLQDLIGGEAVSTLTSGINAMAQYVQIGKGLANWFCPAPVLTAYISLCLLWPFMKWAITLVVSSVRFIYK